MIRKNSNPYNKSFHQAVHNIYHCLHFPIAKGFFKSDMIEKQSGFLKFKK